MGRLVGTGDRRSHGRRPCGGQPAHLRRGIGRLPDHRGVDELLSAADYEREPLPYLAGFAAGKAFLRYRRGGGDKRSPMPDFYIGAHAAVAGYRLLTRDVRRYRTYFPTIDIIAPPGAEDETSS